jgi:hypothetical protein
LKFEDKAVELLDEALGLKDAAPSRQTEQHDLVVFRPLQWTSTDHPFQHQ